MFVAVTATMVLCTCLFRFGLQTTEWMQNVDALEIPEVGLSLSSQNTTWHAVFSKALRFSCASYSQK
jgi:hypothetical protein